jgi:hypothetical protein
VSAAKTYGASTVKHVRPRATHAELEERAQFLIDYAEQHHPVTVRQLYYRAEVEGMPGIGKDENSYRKIQQQVLKLRREGRLDYSHIADATRWMRKSRSYNRVEDALTETARLYRKSLWYDSDDYVEVWIEKDALASVLLPVTHKYDVPLMVTRGYTSETFAYESVAQREDDDRNYWVYALYDFDRSGQHAMRSLEEKLDRFAGEIGNYVNFNPIAVTDRQIRAWNLSTREPKRDTAADKKWPHDFACELDAIEPDLLRALVEKAINFHIDQDQLDVMKVAEESEREWLRKIVKRAKRRTNGASASSP